MAMFKTVLWVLCVAFHLYPVEKPFQLRNPVANVLRKGFAIQILTHLVHNLTDLVFFGLLCGKDPSSRL